MSDDVAGGMPALSDRQIAAAEVAQGDVLELMKRLEQDGFEALPVLVGVTTGLVCAIQTMLGASEVPIWFARFAAQTMHLAKPD